MTYDLIIIGSGPAGLTAAIYGTRANLKVLCIEGSIPGGQLMITTEVENFPGFPHGITGPELVKNIREQAARFGTEFITKNATKVDFSGRTKKVFIEAEEYQSKAVIIATGANAKWLGLENEKKFYNKGVSACATCDGFFFKGKEVAVIGGGDTALEEALFLSKICSKVTIIHRRDTFRASKIMQDRAMNTANVTILWDTVVEDFVGEQVLKSLKLKNLKTNSESELTVNGAFVAIGHKPAVEIFQDHLEMDEMGYIKRVEHSMSSVPGVFVSGDVNDARYRQAITAAAYGCEAAIDVERWLGENP
jgi:thioredoxin reductase (NADPH)